MSTNYSLLFYLKKPKNYAGGAKPIYMRITVAGDPKEVSTGRECDPLRWNAKANRAKGTKEDIRNLNAYLDTLERKVANAHLQRPPMDYGKRLCVLQNQSQAKGKGVPHARRTGQGSEKEVHHTKALSCARHLRVLLLYGAVICRCTETAKDGHR